MKKLISSCVCITFFFSIALLSCTIDKKSTNDAPSWSMISSETRWPLTETAGTTHHLVFKEEGKYASFPSLAINPANEYLYTSFSVKDAPSHMGGEEHERHLSMESRDKGVTWQIIDTLPVNLQDARPGLLSVKQSQSSGGTFIVPDGSMVRIGQYWRRWLPIERLPEFRDKYSITMGAQNRGPGPDYFAYNSGGYLERSDDKGQTWQRTDIPELDVYSSCSSPWSYDQLPDGTVIRAFAMRKTAEDPFFNRVVAVMTRNGRSAQVVDVMGNVPDFMFTEETLVHVTSTGVIWMLTRVHDADSERNNHNLWQAVSCDGGLSWDSKPTLINIGRSPASGLIQLNDGRIVLVAGYRGGANCGIHALVSEDEGLTWRYDRRIGLRQDGHGFDLGYARAIKLKDETIVTIYYYSTADEVKTEKQPTRSIYATRFKVPEF